MSPVLSPGIFFNFLKRTFSYRQPKPGEATLSVRLNMVEVERSLQNVYAVNSLDNDSEEVKTAETTESVPYHGVPHFRC